MNVVPFFAFLHQCGSPPLQLSFGSPKLRRLRSGEGAEHDRPVDKLRRSLGQLLESQGCHSFRITRTLRDHEAGLVFPLSSQRLTSQQRTWHTKVDFIHPPRSECGFEITLPGIPLIGPLNGKSLASATQSSLHASTQKGMVIHRRRDRHQTIFSARAPRFAPVEFELGSAASNSVLLFLFLSLFRFGRLGWQKLTGSFP